MIPTIIILVITMIVDGQEFERHEPMQSLSECWERAPNAMADLLSSHHEGLELRHIGVGCVVDSGDPA